MDLFESIPTEPDDEHQGEHFWAEGAIRAAAQQVFNLAGDGLLAMKEDDISISCSG